MKKHKVVFFWGDNKVSREKHVLRPLRFVGIKEPSYIKLFEKLDSDFEIYLAFGYKRYLGDLMFVETIKYDKGQFVSFSGAVKADVVYDRSLKLKFPGISAVENNKVINCLKFKNLARDKWAFYLDFPEYCPKTNYLGSQRDLDIAVGKLDSKKIYVLKPITGMKAEGIVIGGPSLLASQKVESPMLLQEFVDTSSGIEGITNGHHDLRCVIMGREIVWATVRTPKSGDLRANVAQGGTIEEIALNRLPKSMMAIVTHISEYLSKEYYEPIYSIDIGFENERPYVFEINSQMGFPRPEMNQNRFYEMFAEVAKKKASQ